MSRTYKKEKGSGYEYWSRRGNSQGKWMNIPGKDTKIRTHRNERRLAKRELENGQ